jgi:hypothetical protein
MWVLAITIFSRCWNRRRACLVGHSPPVKIWLGVAGTAGLVDCHESGLILKINFN